MLGALTACLPALCGRHGAAEVSALARAVLPGLVDEPKVVVRINPHMLPTMQAEMASLDFELAERIQLLPTEAVMPGDVADQLDGRLGDPRRRESPAHRRRRLGLARPAAKGDRRCLTRWT